jgi:hypothetical protein
MAQQFHDGAVRFRYPENWTLERQETENGWTVSVQSPDTAFLMLCMREDMPSTNCLCDAALDALKEEYGDIEVESCVESVAGQPAVGHDIHFFAFDLPNSCWTRSFHSPQGTVLLLYQINDLELERNEPVLKAICASLEVEDE